MSKAYEFHTHVYILLSKKDRSIEGKILTERTKAGVWHVKVSLFFGNTLKAGGEIEESLSSSCESVAIAKCLQKMGLLAPPHITESFFKVGDADRYSSISFCREKMLIPLSVGFPCAIREAFSLFFAFAEVGA